MKQSWESGGARRVEGALHSHIPCIAAKLGGLGRRYFGFRFLFAIARAGIDVDPQRACPICVLRIHVLPFPFVTREILKHAKSLALAFHPNFELLITAIVPFCYPPSLDGAYGDKRTNAMVQYGMYTVWYDTISG